jgi:hypothetical protein
VGGLFLAVDTLVLEEPRDSEGLERLFSSHRSGPSPRDLRRAYVYGAHRDRLSRHDGEQSCPTPSSFIRHCVFYSPEVRAGVPQIPPSSGDLIVGTQSSMLSYEHDGYGSGCCLMQRAHPHS